MYWNTEIASNIQGKNMINRNMRCIEIGHVSVNAVSLVWLIETWDVLKWRSYLQKITVLSRINRNMRCIEIVNRLGGIGKTYRLIETWDVLKFLFRWGYGF